MPAKRPAPRLALIDEQRMTEAQSALAGRHPVWAPRGIHHSTRAFRRVDARTRIRSFSAGARRPLPLQDPLPPRLSEFAILCTARLWRAQYEWFAHAPIAEKSGVRQPRQLRICALGRPPKSAQKDERAIYDFVRELYKTRRISDRTYKKRAAHCLATKRLSNWSGYSDITR